MVDGGRDEARPSPVVESGREEARPSPVVEVGRDEARPSPVAESGRDEARPSPVMESGRDEARPSPVAESGRDEARPSPVVEEVREEARPSPVVEEARDEARPSPVVESGRDEARPSPVVEEARDEARPSPVAEEARDEARPSPVVEEVREEAPQPSPETSEETSDASLLGELFDFRRRHAQAADSPTAKGDAPASTLSEETRRNIPIIQETPTWDDAPLEDGESLLDRVLQRLRNINIKIAAAVLGGILLLAVLVFGIALRRHSPSENPDAEMAATKPAQEAQPVAAPIVSKGDTVYTANLIPPPDSYVE